MNRYNTQKKYRICFISYYLSPYGGVIKRLKLWIKYLNKKKFHITIILSSPYITEIKKYFNKFPEINLIDITQLRKRKLFLFAAMFRLYKIIYKEKYDLIVTMYPRTDLIVGLICKFIRDHNIVSYIAGPNIFIKYPSLKKFVSHLFYRFINKEFKYFITLSRYDKKWLIKDYSLPPSKIIVNRIGIDFNEHKIENVRKKGIVFGFAGKLSFEKGIVYLINAFHSIQKETQSDIKLKIAGTGNFKGYYENMVIKLGIQNKVYFQGWITNISNFLNSIDVLVLPSLSEGTPRIILEAYFHKIPVIASKIGGIPEILQDGITGFLVRPKSVKELKEKMKYFINNPSNINGMGVKTKSYVEKSHNITDELNNLERIFRRAIEN
ncbi:MAG: glycosyltransferase family 4 protein [Candidatus Helarchaeota archaeon]